MWNGCHTRNKKIGRKQKNGLLVSLVKNDEFSFTTLSGGGVVRRWHLPTRSKVDLKALAGQAEAMALAECGRTVVALSAGADRLVAWRSADDFTTRAMTFALPEDAALPATCLAAGYWTGDVLVGCADGEILHYDVAALFDMARPDPAVCLRRRMREHRCALTMLRVGEAGPGVPAGEFTFASAGRDGTVRIWDTTKIPQADEAWRTPKQRFMAYRTLYGHTGRITGVWLLGDDVVTASTDGSLRRWDLHKGRCTSVMYGHTGEVAAAAVQYDRLVSGGSVGDGRVCLWDPTAVRQGQGVCVRVFAARAPPARAAADGGRVGVTSLHPVVQHILATNPFDTLASLSDQPALLGQILPAVIDHLYANLAVIATEPAGHILGAIGAWIVRDPGLLTTALPGGQGTALAAVAYVAIEAPLRAAALGRYDLLRALSRLHVSLTGTALRRLWSQPDPVHAPSLVTAEFVVAIAEAIRQWNARPGGRAIREIVSALDRLCDVISVAMNYDGLDADATADELVAALDGLPSTMVSSDVVLRLGGSPDPVHT